MIPFRRGAILAFAALIAVPALSQGLLSSGERQQAQEAVPGSVEIRVGLGTPEARQFADLLSRDRERLEVNGVRVIRISDPVEAVGYFRALATMLEDNWTTEKQVVDVPLAHADPRSVRAVLGREALLRDPQVGVWCREDPPSIRLLGPAELVEPVAARVRELDVVPAEEPGPTATVRHYLEHWLIPTESQPNPDAKGMYALTTRDARASISGPEFAFVVERSGGGPGNVGVGSTGEIVAIYPPRYSEDGQTAVVDYSIAWTSTSRGGGAGGGNWGGGGFGGGGGATGISPEQALALAEAARNLSDYNSQVPAGVNDVLAAPPPQVRRDGQARLSVGGLYRGQAVVLLDADGQWRLPMAYDAQTQTWLTPLSPTLVGKLAPTLNAIPSQRAVGDGGSW